MVHVAFDLEQNRNIRNQVVHVAFDLTNQI